MVRMEGLVPDYRGGTARSDWMCRSDALTADRREMVRRIMRLEKEIEVLNGKLRDREEACRTMREISIGMATMTSDLHKLAASFNIARSHLLDLSQAEKIVFDMLIAKRGIPTKEIADRLHITERTVKFHIDKILRKAGVRSRNEL